MNSLFRLAGEGRSLWVASDRVTMKARGEQTAGAFTAFESYVPPGGGTPPHRHSREEESFFVLEGEIEFRSDGQSFRGAAGAWVTLPRGSVHQFLNTTDRPARMLIVASPAGIEHFFDEVGVESDVPVPVTVERVA